MIIEKIEVGYLKENCYILKKDNNCLIIDPGDDFYLIKEKVNNINVLGVLITHNHFDHIGALDEVINEYKTEVYNKINLNEGIKNIGEFSFEVIYNPGHSSDSISFYFKKENVIFVGDFIFKDSIGRCDLESGDINEMKKSLDKFKNKFKDNKDLTIYPGHGNKTTLERELNNNIYLQ